MEPVSAPIKRIHGVHGIWTHGKDSVDRVGHNLQSFHDFTYLDCNYPYNKLVEQRSQDLLEENAQVLLSELQPGDHILAHSNGASIVYEALKHLPFTARLGVIVLVAPAFESKTPWPSQNFEKLVVMHNKHDRALLAGQFLYKHKFGALGRFGYRGLKDDRILNVDIKQRWGGDWPLNHSWMFRDKFLAETTRRILRLIHQHGGNNGHNVLLDHGIQ